jgi:hypothetical protein
MKIEDLLKLRIDIQTKDDTSFLELAIFFDKPEFLQMLPQFRKDYGIGKLIDPDKFYETTGDLDKKTARINFSKYQKPKELVENSSSLDEKMDMYQMLDTEANLVCYQFKRPPCFDEAVKQAIFCGCFEGDSLGTTTVEIIENGRLLNVSDFQLPQLAILISPNTTYKTLKSSFQVAQMLYKTNPKLTYFRSRVDFVNNIRKYRYFYWKRLAGKTYEQIANDWRIKQIPKDDMTTYLEAMRGVKIYTKLLQT